MKDLKEWRKYIETQINIKKKEEKEEVKQIFQQEFPREEISKDKKILDKENISRRKKLLEILMNENLTQETVDHFLELYKKRR